MKAQNLNDYRIKQFCKEINIRKYSLFPKIIKEDIVEHTIELIEQQQKYGKLFISSKNNDIEAVISLKLLEWDSKHFGYKCATLDQYYYNKNLDHNALVYCFRNILLEVMDYATSENISFLSISVNSWDSFLSQVLQKIGFNFVLTWIDGLFLPSKPLPLYYSEYEVEIVTESEVSSLQKIAKQNYFKGGRFYLDSNFDIEKVNEMYSELVLNSFYNNDILLSYKFGGEPIGLFICKKIQTFGKSCNIKIAPLRFLVIRDDLKKKNIGKDLFIKTLNYLFDKCDVITTGFECHNLPSLNLHSKLMFKFNHTHNVFHWWNPKN